MIFNEEMVDVAFIRSSTIIAALTFVFFVCAVDTRSGSDS